MRSSFYFYKKQLIFFVLSLSLVTYKMHIIMNFWGIFMCLDQCLKIDAEHSRSNLHGLWFKHRMFFINGKSN